MTAINSASDLSLVILDAIADPLDKCDECHFFISLIEKETDRAQFRWLISAFISAANSFFDIASKHAHERFFDPETGVPVADESALDVLMEYVKVTPDKTVAGRYKTKAKHSLLKELRKLRNGNTHERPISIMAKSSRLPEDFDLGYVRGKGKPALVFCREVMNLIDAATGKLQNEL